MLRLKKPYFLGIDFGTSYIKVVELTIKDEQPYLVNYGDVEMGFTEGNKAFEFHSPEERVAAYLQALLRKLELKSEAAHVSLPGFSGLITLLEMPAMKPDELEQAIRFEAHKYIPSSLDEVSLSWDIVSKKSKEVATGRSQKMEVLLVAALTKEVQKYERYIESSGLKMEVLELETFSLARALTQEKEGTYLIIDIGSRATNLVLVEGGVVKVNRNLNSGGNEITSTLAEGLNISWERAESLKKGDKDFLNIKESSLVFPALEIIGNEATRIFNAYQAKNGDKRPDGVILSGGTAKMKGLDIYFANVLNTSVTLGNPWKGIRYNDALKSSIERMGTSYSVALGLALGGVDAYERS